MANQPQHPNTENQQNTDCSTDAGVNIDTIDALINFVKPTAKNHARGVLNGRRFGALFEISKYQNPVLVSGTDGVGK